MAVRRMADTIENEGGASIGEKDCYQQWPRTAYFHRGSRSTTCPCPATRYDEPGHQGFAVIGGILRQNAAWNGGDAESPALLGQS
jgi:hypothetical protein